MKQPRPNPHLEGHLWRWQPLVCLQGEEEPGSGTRHGPLGAACEHYGLGFAILCVVRRRDFVRPPALSTRLAKHGHACKPCNCGATALPLPLGTSMNQGRR